jgi:hypothetical protein
MFEGGVSRRAEAKYLREGGKDGAKRVLACDVSTSLIAAKGWLAGLSLIGRKLVTRSRESSSTDVVLVLYASESGYTSHVNSPKES